jgi:CRISPR system Cascade subunit CasB
MSEAHPFVSYLEGLRDDRGALAALRRGLGQPPGTVASMYRYVVPWLPDGAKPSQEAACYQIAAFFAYHPEAGGVGNMGDHFGRTRSPQGDDTAIERRFTALLGAHSDDLPLYLRQAVSFLRSKEIPINWHQLFHDLRRWGYQSRIVQKDWARAFWGRAVESAEQAAGVPETPGALTHNEED